MSAGSRLGNQAVNLALVVLGIVAIVLVYGLVSRWTGPDSAAPVRAFGVEGDIVQVDVRNGCGVVGVAGRMTAYLRSRGFDVVEEGNHDSFDEPETIILDRIGNPAAAQALARAVGLPADRIRTDLRDDYFLDATIVIGADYESVLPWSSDE